MNIFRLRGDLDEYALDGINEVREFMNGILAASVFWIVILVLVVALLIRAG